MDVSRVKSEIITVVVAGNFFVRGGFSPIDAPTHFNVMAAHYAYTKLILNPET